MTTKTSASFDDVIPEVGMGATHVMFSDLQAYTVIEIISKREIVVQRNEPFRVPSELKKEYSYVFSPNKNGKKVTITKRKSGEWREKCGTDKFVVGVRQEYFDLSF